MLQQPRGLGVIRRAGRDGHLQPPQAVNAVVVNFREHDLLPQAQRKIAASVKPPAGNPPEVPDARQRGHNHPLQKIIHPVAPQRHRDANGVALPHLEPGNGTPRPGNHRLLPRYGRQIPHRAFHRPSVGQRLAQPDIQVDFGNPGRPHRAGEAEFVDHRRHDFILVAGLERRRGQRNPGGRIVRLLTPLPAPAFLVPALLGIPLPAVALLLLGSGHNPLPFALTRPGCGTACSVRCSCSATASRWICGWTLPAGRAPPAGCPGGA